MSQSHSRSALIPSRKYAALGVAAILLLSGCGGSAGSDEPASPRSSERSTATATPTPTPTPTPTQEYKPASAEGPAQNVPLPKMPEAAKKETKEGLEAFSKYVIALFSYGYETGDVEPMKTAINSDCDVCANYFTTVEAAYRDDSWLGGAKLEVRQVVSEFKKTPEGKYQVILDIAHGAMQYHEPGEKNPDSEGFSRAAFIMEAEFADGVWRATELSVIKKVG